MSIKRGVENQNKIQKY
uniref:Uncharacterized protein n=1 Tax=Arundo donax TaxID=35708 RepID=A0A0A8YUW1_ARUDO